MKKAFIDLDGTILNSKLRHQVVLENALKEYDITNQDISNYVEYKAEGKDTKKYLKEFIGLCSMKLQKVSEYWTEHIEDPQYLKLDCLYDDCFCFLDSLVNLDYSIVIVTARKDKNYISNFIKESSIRFFVNEIKVVSPVNAKVEKLNFLKKSALPNSIMVGDTEVDYEAGMEADIITYILNRGFRNKTYWDSRNIYSYKSLKEILREIQLL